MDFSFPEEFRYLETHEYVSLSEDIATIGITDYAVEQLGEITHIEVPEVGDTVAKGDSFGAIDSHKAYSELIAPITGEVVEVNELLLNDYESGYEILKDDSYDKGWLIKLKFEDISEYEDLSSSVEYQDIVSNLS